MKLSRRSLLGGVAATPLAPAQTQAPQNALNLISIGVDTWGVNWLGCYGNTKIRTPNVDALAAKSALFLDAYPEALPTLPARRSLYTGRRIFPSERFQQPDDQVRIRGWHPLFADDVTLSETLNAAGYTTSLITDIYHQFKPGKNFHRGFDAWRFIRGQESDRLESGPRKSVRLFNYLHHTQRGTVGPLQYLLNRRDWRTEEDWLSAQVFREAGRWLENNIEDGQPFYLHVESFSPHEYWDPPEEYYRLYMKSAYTGPKLIHPPLVTKDMSAVEVEHVRALYGGLVTFVDACIGKFMRKVETLGLLKNSIIVFVSDHGTMMGEQGQLHKAEIRLRNQVTRVPLAIYNPRENWAGRKIAGFVQHTDVMPTLLDLLGVKPPARVTGESLRPLLESGEASRRDSIIIGWGEHASVRTPEWNYIGRWSHGAPFEELYDLRSDPEELNNVVPAHPALVAEFRRTLKAHVDGGWTITKGTFTRLA